MKGRNLKIPWKEKDLLIVRVEHHKSNTHFFFSPKKPSAASRKVSQNFITYFILTLLQRHANIPNIKIFQMFKLANALLSFHFWLPLHTFCSGKWFLIRTQQNKLKKLLFQKKSQESFHTNLYFNKFVVEKVQTQKCLGRKTRQKTKFQGTS